MLECVVIIYSIFINKCNTCKTQQYKLCSCNLFVSSCKFVGTFQRSLSQKTLILGCCQVKLSFSLAQPGLIVQHFKKSLKIPIGYSEAINRRTDNTMAKRQKIQKDKQRSTKPYTENKRSRNTNPIKNRGRTQVLQKGKQFLLHILAPIVLLLLQKAPVHIVAIILEEF